jgi:hypothetical protein
MRSKEILGVKKKALASALLLFVGGCAGVPQTHLDPAVPTKAEVAVNANYDKTWKSAMRVVGEVQMCEGCFFEITTSDKSSGVISALSSRENQMKGQLNLKVTEISDKTTNLAVMGSISVYKYWGNLYGARFKERWENVPGNFLQTMAGQISVEATDSFGGPDEDIYLKVLVDKKEARKGEAITLEYVFYTRYMTKVEELSRAVSVENEILRPNSLMLSYFGVSTFWDDVRNMGRVDYVQEDGPASNVLYEGDFRVKINDKEITNHDKLTKTLGSQTKNEEVKFSILRSNTQLDVTILPILNRWERNEVVRFGFSYGHGRSHAGTEAL